jgi:hypothetical protein
MPKPEPPMCRAPLYNLPGESCFRHAALLSTDVDPKDPHGYVPVCKVHHRLAISDGLRRMVQQPAGYRVPMLILPLDTAA